MEFIKSAIDPKDYPPPSRPEVVVAGRSNAGKSSIMNAISGKKSVYVSKKPGKTNLLNFFEYNDRYRWVDIPGYGFSKRPGGEQQAWQSMVETFLGSRECLAGLVLVMDIRRDWTHDEQDLVDWISFRHLPWIIAATKSDKLSKHEVQKRCQILQKTSLGGVVFPVSSLSSSGVMEFEEYIFRHWIKPLSKSSAVEAE